VVRGLFYGSDAGGDDSQAGVGDDLKPRFFQLGFRFRVGDAGLEPNDLGTLFLRQGQYLVDQGWNDVRPSEHVKDIHLYG